MLFYSSPHRGATERGGWPTLVHSSFSHSIASYSSAFTGGIPTILVSCCWRSRQYGCFVLCLLLLFSDIIKYKVNAHGNEDHAPPKDEFNSCKRHCYMLDNLLLAELREDDTLSGGLGLTSHTLVTNQISLQPVG